MSGSWIKAMAVWALLVPLAAEAILVDTELLDPSQSGMLPQLEAGIARSIERGVWDKQKLTFAILATPGALERYRSSLIRENGRTYLAVTSKTFDGLPAAVQKKVVERLASYYDPQYSPIYRVTVEQEGNQLGSEPVIESLHIDLTSLPLLVPAEDLLSPYAKTWAYKRSHFDGPNCWHTAIAAINLGWEKDRYMRPDEFTCHVRTSFKPIDKPAQWGDLVRLTAQGEVHGFTFLGFDRKDPNRWIVFTKNGYQRGYYLFMDYNTVTETIYPGSTASFYRKTSDAVDPADNPSAPCAAYYARNGGDETREDPIIVAGLRRKDPRTFPPLKLN